MVAMAGRLRWNGVRAGEQWFCEVSPPLPYRLNFSVTLTDVVPEKFVRARIGGDIGGWAELSATDAPAKVRRGERVTHGEGTAGSAGSVDYHGSAERRRSARLRVAAALSAVATESRCCGWSRWAPDPWLASVTTGCSTAASASFDAGLTTRPR